MEESDALIYAIGYNTTQSDFPLLRWMSELSGGRAFQAQTNEIADITAKIGLKLAQSLRDRLLGHGCSARWQVSQLARATDSAPWHAAAKDELEKGVPLAGRRN